MARLPRWQHVAYLVLCTLTVVAAVVNALVAETLTRRLGHLAAALATGTALVLLARWYARRS